MAHAPTPAAPGSRLLADIGGTNARFAWQDGPGAPIADEQTLPTAGFPAIEDAIRAYLRATGHATPRACAIAIANPILDDAVRMTNGPWAFSASALRAAIGLERLVLLNDFTALALALPDLEADQLRQVGGGRAQPNAAVGLIGPGTGLGVSGLVPDGRGGWVPLQGEGGHATLVSRTPREAALIDALGRQFGHVSAERAVSGPGLVDLHAALFAVDGLAVPPAPPSAAEILAAALDGSGARCTEAIELFCAFLGTMAGNLALTLGARGGVYIGGGIVPRLGTVFDRTPFRERFEAKGRFREYLAAIPVWVIDAARSPALSGAARALDSAPGS